MRLFADLIDAFARAEGPPPDRLGRFLRWALRGAFPAIIFGFAISVAVGATEVGAAAVVGWLIDLAQAVGPGELFAESWHWLLAAAVFFLVVDQVVGLAMRGVLGLG